MDAGRVIMGRRRRVAGLSLIELLLVIAVMAILAAVVVPHGNPTIHDQLHATARFVAVDLSYARSLAVTYGSTYRVAFDVANNRYWLEHTGSNAALDRLPDTPFLDGDDSPTRHVVALGEMPHLGPTVRLATVEAEDSGTTIGDVEFGPLGETTRTEPSLIWFSAGEGPARRSLAIRVDPITGLAAIDVDSYTAQGPVE
jgi:prepilin-type N-terminal cleavage/methylation domain-containing protein